MNIAMIGYGKMGKAIDEIAAKRGHKITSRFDSAHPVNREELLDADVAIEFTRPELASGHIRMCLEAECPVVVGTTGWYEHFAFIEEQVKKSEGSLLCATNFSLGVNITFFMNEVLARIMNHYPDYAASITEIHHTRKLDAPSGTAISLAEGIMDHHQNYDGWKLQNGEILQGKIPVTAIRENDIPGTHTVLYNSDIDSLELRHTAHNRTGFALGAVLAAEWLKDKKGVFGMRDMLNFGALI